MDEEFLVKEGKRIGNALFNQAYVINDEEILLVTEKQYQTDIRAIEAKRGNNEIREIIIVPDWVLQLIRNNRIK